MDSKNKKWQNWDSISFYGDMFYKRAIGELDEMESSKAAARLLKQHYQTGDSLLDVGCGAGHYLRSLKSILDEKVNYHGVDPTAYYVELAQKAWKDEAEFTVGSIFELPFPDNSFDIVMCNNVLIHLPPNMQVPMRELIRVARKKVIVRTVFGERNYLVREILEDQDFDKSAGVSDNYPSHDLNDLSFNYLNIYTERYMEDVIRHSFPAAKVSFQADNDWEPFDNRDDSGIKTGTRTIGHMQISGSLVFDWRFMVIDK